MNLHEIFMVYDRWDEGSIRIICRYLGCVREDSKLVITHGSRMKMENIHEDKY